MDIGESQQNTASSHENESISNNEYYTFNSHESQQGIVPNNEFTRNNIHSSNNETQTVSSPNVTTSNKSSSNFLDWSDPDFIIKYKIKFCNCGDNICDKYNINILDNVITNLSKCNSVIKARRLYYWMQIKNFINYPPAINYFNIQMYKIIIINNFNTPINKISSLYYILILNKTLYISEISILLSIKILQNTDSSDIINECIKYLYILSNYENLLEYISQKNILQILTNYLTYCNHDMTLFYINKIFYNISQTKNFTINEENIINFTFNPNYKIIDIFKEIFSNNNILQKIKSNLQSQNKTIPIPNYLLNIFTNFYDYINIDKNNIIKDFIDKLEFNSTENTSCSICLEDIEIPCKRLLEQELITLSCGHSFHKNCISSWIYKEASCPNCRKKIIIDYPKLIHPQTNFQLHVRPIFDIDATNIF